MPIQADSVPAESNEKFNARSEWLPIETAPKDGTRILVGGQPFTPIQIVRWISAPHNHWSIDGSRFVRVPTHWMPLPSPPGAELNISNEPERTAVSLKSDNTTSPKQSGGQG